MNEAILEGIKLLGIAAIGAFVYITLLVFGLELSFRIERWWRR